MDIIEKQKKTLNAFLVQFETKIDTTKYFLVVLVMNCLKYHQGL